MHVVVVITILEFCPPDTMGPVFLESHLNCLFDLRFRLFGHIAYLRYSIISPLLMLVVVIPVFEVCPPTQWGHSFMESHSNLIYFVCLLWGLGSLAVLHFDFNKEKPFFE